VQVAVADTAVVDAHRDVVVAQVTALDRNPPQPGGAARALPAGGHSVPLVHGLVEAGGRVRRKVRNAIGNPADLAVISATGVITKHRGCYGALFLSP
jgi:hypothetical protein